MRAGQPSRTARQNALFRALEARRPAQDRVADDFLAARFLTPEFRPLAGLARVPAVRRLIETVIDSRWPCVRGGVVARTRLIDETVVAELPRVRQVTNYLGPEAVDTTFRFLASALGPGSPVLFTYVDRGMLDGTADFAGAATTMRAVRRVGEPFTFGLDPGEVPGYLAGRDLALEWDTPVSAAAARFYPAGRCPTSPAYYHVALARRP